MEFIIFMLLFLIPVVIGWMWWAGQFNIILRIIVTLLLVGAFWYLWDGENGYGNLFERDVPLISQETEKSLRESHFTKDKERNDAIRATVAIEESFSEMRELHQDLFDENLKGTKQDWLNQYESQISRMDEGLNILEETQFDDEQKASEMEEWVFEMKKHVIFHSTLVESVRDDDSAEAEGAFIIVLRLYYANLKDLENNDTK
jgi:hypothetical protein